MTRDAHAAALTREGVERVEAAASRHGVSTEAVIVLLRALERGGGNQAQFSHPDLGGMGQWSRHGMIMIGDMFNSGLKARVDALCNALADWPIDGVLTAPTPGSFRDSAWWPEGCGTPGASGSQNDMRYAVFPETARLAIQRGATIEVYDTGDHRIGGVSQQQSGGQDLAFTSHHGTVRLHELSRVGDIAAPRATPEPTASEAGPDRPVAAAAPQAPVSDVFASIERLHDLHRKGILTESEFATKKQELLGRL